MNDPPKALRIIHFVKRRDMSPPMQNANVPRGSNNGITPHIEMGPPGCCTAALEHSSSHATFPASQAFLDGAGKANLRNCRLRVGVNSECCDQAHRPINAPQPRSLGRAIGNLSKVLPSLVDSFHQRASWLIQIQWRRLRFTDPSTNRSHRC